MHTNKRGIGRIGESIARDYLLEKSYTILDQNFQIKRGEIDIIAQASDQVIAFIEVKNYHPNSQFHPLESMPYSRQKKLITVAKYFIAKHDLSDNQFRFDLIIVKDNKVSQHLENIFSV